MASAPTSTTQRTSRSDNSLLSPFSTYCMSRQQHRPTASTFPAPGSKPGLLTEKNENRTITGQLTRHGANAAASCAFTKARCQCMSRYGALLQSGCR